MPNPPGTYRRNPASYTDLGNGTVRDEVTCLVWQRATSSGTYTWANAKSHCAALALGGRSDWHLPSRIELTTLVNFDRSGPAIDTDAFPSTVVGFYWTSTPWAVKSSPSKAWIINFYEGLTSNGANTPDAFRVRCVASPAGSGSSTLQTVSPGQTKDLHTKLIWQRKGSSVSYTAGKASSICSKLTLGGHTNWRLPTIKELATTVDDRVVAPAIKANWFTNTDKKAWYWSSSYGLDSNGKVSTSVRWALSYDDGYTNFRSITSGRVRCVR